MSSRCFKNSFYSSRMSSSCSRMSSNCEKLSSNSSAMSSYCSKMSSYCSKMSSYCSKMSSYCSKMSSSCFNLSSYRSNMSFCSSAFSTPLCTYCTASYVNFKRACTCFYYLLFKCTAACARVHHTEILSVFPLLLFMFSNKDDLEIECTITHQQHRPKGKLSFPKLESICLANSLRKSHAYSTQGLHSFLFWDFTFSKVVKKNIFRSPPKNQLPHGIKFRNLF